MLIKAQAYMPWMVRLVFEEEEDMLDLVPEATRASRLACQIMLSPDLDGCIARIP